MLYLDDFLITFCDHNISKRQLLLPWINISMANQAYFSPKWILTPQKKTSCNIFKLAIFSKFFLDFIRHIIGWNAGKGAFNNYVDKKRGMGGQPKVHACPPGGGGHTGRNDKNLFQTLLPILILILFNSYAIFITSL